MSGETNSDLSRALSQLTLFTLWREAGLPGQAPDRDGVYRSPFREDRTASFSVGGGGKFFKDFGRSEVAGGIIQFAKLCWTSDSDDQIKDRLVDLAGTRTHRQAAAPATPGAAVVIPPALVKAAKNLEKRAQAAAQLQRIYDEHEALYKPEIEESRKFVPLWPDCVRDRYADGVAMMAADPKLQEKLAKDRGWPVQWVEELVALEQVSYCWERGCDAGGRWARRQKAFRIDYPIITGDLEEGAAATLQPVGYHQRFFMPAEHGRDPKKGWMYLPGFPKKEPRSAYEKAIVDEGLKRGLKWEPERVEGGRLVGGVRDRFISGLPFVLGDLDRPKVIVILEGQWDAITFFGACGWFHDTTPAAGVAVFGIRGAEGMDTFLGYWWRWLRCNRPLAWVIADNDTAGEAWRKVPEAKLGQLQPPSLADRLARAGCRDVKLAWLKPGKFGKDFNDYYKAARPDVSKMHIWMKKTGVMTASGGWA